MRCAQQFGALPSFSRSSYHVALSLCRSRTVVCFLAQRALCRQRNAPADCCCRTTPGQCTFPRSDIHQHVRSVLSSKRKGSQLRLAQRNSFRSTSSPRASPRRVESLYLCHIPVAALFPLQPAQRRQMAVLSATCLLSSKYHREAYSLAGKRRTQIGLWQRRTCRDERDVLPFSSSLPELWCCVESLGQRKTNNAASVSLLEHFAERELHGRFRLCETASKCLYVELRKIRAQHTVAACSVGAEERQSSKPSLGFSSVHTTGGEERSSWAPA